ncbi:MAG: mechanosensitive ion channel [Chromatiaceae bacterium]|nr:mechanosensitive ion channel [Chromatiaceae bacterium]
MRSCCRIPPLTRCVAILAMVFSISASVAADSDDRAKAVTASDASLPPAELALLLKPLSKDELLIEAEAWRGIVKSKAEQIARVEIAIRRQNLALKKADEIKEKATDAHDSLEKVSDKVSEAKASGDPRQMAEAEQAAAEARDTIDAVDTSIDEAVAAVKRRADIQQGLPDQAGKELDEMGRAAEQAKAAVSNVQKTIASAQGKTGEAAKAIAAQAHQATEEAKQAAGQVPEKVDDALHEAMAATERGAMLDDAVTGIERAKQEGEAKKIDLLEQLNLLRTQRTVLLDNLRAVIEELQAKTDKGDTTTLAKIRDYRLYISGLSGIHVDVTDTTSAWVSVVGWIGSEEGGLRWLFNISSFVGILVAAWFAAKLVSRMMQKALGRLSLPALPADFLIRSTRWLVMLVGVIWALSALEVSVAPLLAMVGAASFIIAFAMQDSLSNFASGLMILFFRPFDMRDVVDAGGVSGTVSSMNLVSTTIRTFDNKLMVVPNSKIWSDVITNATNVTERRVDMEFGIGYDDDIDQALSILEEIVAGHPKVLKLPAPLIKLSALADSSVNFICRPWARPADYWDVYWDVTKEVKKRFDAAGIGIPFPQRDVHLYLEPGAQDHPVAALARRAARRAGTVRSEPEQLDGGLDV